VQDLLRGETRMSLNVVAWDETKQRLKLTDKDASLIGLGSQGNRSGSVVLVQGDLTKTVTFTTPMTTANYTVNIEFFNDTDSSVLFQDIIVTNKTINGFTTKWNYPLDSNNFSLEYTASTYGYSLLSGSVNLSQGTTSKTITITPSFVDTNYIVTLNFYNGVDADLVYQPMTITGKTTSQFIVKWNSPLLTDNYVLEYHINIIS
jgi:hypothetical protein